MLASWLLTRRQNRQADRSSPKGSRFSMENPVMRNRLQVSFWGLHLTAEGIMAIAAAVAIVIAVLAACAL
jgi:hypothetical protein